MNLWQLVRCKERGRPYYKDWKSLDYDITYFLVIIMRFSSLKTCAICASNRYILSAKESTFSKNEGVVWQNLRRARSIFVFCAWGWIHAELSSANANIDASDTYYWIDRGYFGLAYSWRIKQHYCFVGERGLGKGVDETSAFYNPKNQVEQGENIWKTHWVSARKYILANVSFLHISLSFPKTKWLKPK